MMGETPLAAMGAVVQWTSGVLLFLLFFRLRRSGARRDAVRIWTAAWSVQAISVSGDCLRAVGVLIGRPLDETWYHTLNALSVPGTLLFTTLAAIGALQGVGRAATKTVLRVLIAVALGLGFAVAIAGIPALTGFVLVATTIVVYFGLAIGVVRGERRVRRHWLPLLPIAMCCFGVVTAIYQLGTWFGSIFWPIDDFAAIVGWSAGYGTALVTLILGGALITRMMDDAFRGTIAVLDARVRRALAVDRHPGEAAERGPRPEVVEVLEVVEASVELFEVAEAEPAAEPADEDVDEEPALITAGGAAPRRKPRTATLPLPPVFANGRLGEAFLIDDEASVRSTLARIFQRGGWPVRDASTGEEALAWLLDVPPDETPTVILCDVKMPGMGGQGVYEHLRRERPDLLSRLVFVTGDAASESTGAFIAATECVVVEKPFTVSEIARAVEEVLAATILSAG